MKNLQTLLWTLPFLLILSACAGDAKSALGMKKPAPDEFVVISNQPLSMPPELATHNDKANNDVGHHNVKSHKAVKSVGHQQGQLSTEEEAFLSLLGSDDGHKSELKRSIDNEYLNNQNQIESQNSVGKTLSKLRGSDVDKVIDPVKEKERISENLEAGRPVNDGEVKNKSESTLKRIFN